MSYITCAHNTQKLLAPLGIMREQLRVPLKPLEHHSTILPRGFRRISIWLPWWHKNSSWCIKFQTAFFSGTRVWVILLHSRVIYEYYLRTSLQLIGKLCINTPSRGLELSDVYADKLIHFSDSQKIQLFYVKNITEKYGYYTERKIPEFLIFF